MEMETRGASFMDAYDKVFSSIRGAIAALYELNALADDAGTKAALHAVYAALSKANRAMYEVPDIPI